MWETLLPGSGTGFSQVVGYCLVRLFQRKKPTLTTPTLEKKLSNLGQFALIRYVIRWSHIAKSSWTNVVNWAFSTRFVVHPDWVKALTLQYRRGNVANFTIKTIRRKQILRMKWRTDPKRSQLCNMWRRQWTFFWILRQNILWCFASESIAYTFIYFLLGWSNGKQTLECTYSIILRQKKKYFALRNA